MQLGVTPVAHQDEPSALIAKVGHVDADDHVGGLFQERSALGIVDGRGCGPGGGHTCVDFVAQDFSVGEFGEETNTLVARGCHRDQDERDSGGNSNVRGDRDSGGE